MKFLNNIDLQKNEIQNFRVQNLALAPENPVAGQHYFNTADGTEYVYDGTKWVDALSQGDYTFQNGLVELTGADARKVEIKLATGEDAGNIVLAADSKGLKATVAEASTTEKGIIEIATDEEAATGTSETLAVNPKQLKTKVDANEAITAATKTKITYDAKGLVTAGADLSESDLPSIHLEKVTDVTASAAEVNVLDGITASTEELNILDGVTADKDELNILDGATLTTEELNYVDGVTSPIQEQLDNKVAKNADITAGTKTKITYDAKGLVTGGADLSEADIPSLHLEKISDVTVSATEVNQLDGIESNVQDQLNDKVAKNNAIEGATKCKITYDAKGLVTAGADLSEADIPELGAAKIANLTGYAKATEIAALSEADTALQAFGKIQASLDNKIALTALSIESESEDYLTYDASTGEFGAKVTDSATQSSTDLITAGGVYEATKSKIELTDLAIDSASEDFAAYDNMTGKFTIKGGQANGLATLDANGLVPSTQLPSYVDDVIELKSITTEPASAAEGDMYYNSTSKKIFKYSGSAWGDAQDPETGKIYVCNDMAYRWSGSAMIQIGADKLKGFNGTIEGDGTTTTFTINHALGTRNVVFEIYDAATYEKVYVQVIHSTTNAVQVIFAQAPAVGEDYIITVIAIV